MARPERLLALGAMAVAVWLGGRWLFPSDEAQVRAVLDRIEEATRIGDGEGEMVRLGRLAALRELLHPELAVDAGAPFGALQGREAVLAAVGRAGHALRELEIAFVDVSVVVAPDRQSADVSLVAEARFRGERDPTRGYEARELQVHAVRHESRWVVAEVALVRALAPVG